MTGNCSDDWHKQQLKGRWQAVIVGLDNRWREVLSQTERIQYPTTLSEFHTWT
jgi:hypothetical protein